MMSEIKYIQYKRSNKDRARENRSHQTYTEKILRGALRKGQIGYLFLRQKMIDSFILDFYCSQLLLGIEADGKIHDKNKTYDMQRDEKLRHIGVKVIRYTNDAIQDNLIEVVEDIKKEIIIRKLELANKSN